MSEFVINTSLNRDRSTTNRWVFSYLSQSKLLILVIFVGALGNATLAAALPILIGIAFNAVLEEPANTTLLRYAALGVVISQVVRAVLQFGRNFSSTVVGERMERDMREELYISFLGKSMAFHDMQSVGDTMARFTNDVHEINLMMSRGVNLFVGSVSFMIMPVILAPRYHPLLILVPLSYVIIYVFILVHYLGILRPIADWARLAFGQMNSRLFEAIDGMELIKGAGKEDQEMTMFHKNAYEYRTAAVTKGKIEARFLPLLLMGITQAIGFALALYLYSLGEISIGAVIAYMGLLALFRNSTFISFIAYSRISSGLSGASRVLEIMKRETWLDENAAGNQGNIVGAIKFENVSFGYVDDTYVLQNISFSLEPGQMVAIVGQTGSGKSSIIKLINRTYDVENGSVLIDDIDVRNWNLATLRQQIAIVEQDIFLFSRSIADNIIFGCSNATQEAVEKAACAAQAHEFIIGFRDGYDTIIGERGVTLSGGQRQRLALARALLMRPRILVLDDSMSAVDSATEDLIQRAIIKAAEQQTTILITHRISQIRRADLILVMRNSCLEAKGTHDELMVSLPSYRRIFEQYEAIES